MMAKICYACLFLHHASQCDEVLSVLHLQILSGKIIPCHVCHGYCVTLLSLFQIPASLTCSKLCGVQRVEMVRIISRAKCIRASTIIVDSTTRLKMEVTRGVEIVQDQDSMPCWPGDIRGWVGGLAGQLRGLPTQHRGGVAGACARQVHLEE